MSYERRKNEIMAIALGHLSQHHFVSADPKQWKTRRFLALGVVQSQGVYFPTLAKGAKHQADFQNGSRLAININSHIFKRVQKNTSCHWFLNICLFNPAAPGLNLPLSTSDSAWLNQRPDEKMDFFRSGGGLSPWKYGPLKLFLVIPPKIDCTTELVALEKRNLSIIYIYT